jgi:hypothetical protein
VFEIETFADGVALNDFVAHFDIGKGVWCVVYKGKFLIGCGEEKRREGRNECGIRASPVLEYWSNEWREVISRSSD